MRLCRFGENRLGLVEGGRIRDVTAALDALPACRYPFPRFDLMVASLDTLRKHVAAIAGAAPEVARDGLRLLSPVANPGKVIGAPVNYQKHLDEARSDQQLHHNNQIAAIHRAGLFLKASSSLVGPGEGIALRKLDRRNDHEVELGVVIGKTANNVSARNAVAYVAGYGIGLDITIRGPEERCLRKSPDSYAVFGPWLVTADEIDNPNDLDLSIQVNGETRQSSNTSQMILDVGELIEYASAFYSLDPGDVIMTGTPEGVGPIVPGDTILASIERIGSMQVEVRAAGAP
jgi:2-keto-4-pentenoate hydratase/2-oxohepta-3-ene-1,7-dioic acid hydratase in catechol pathway